VSEVIELTYCERCASSLDDEGFDYRFEYPICFKCVYKYHLEPIEEGASERAITRSRLVCRTLCLLL
jgi:hypothetical protein